MTEFMEWHFWIVSFATLTFVALVSSSQMVLVNTADSAWYWVTKRIPGDNVQGWTRNTNPTRYAACDVNLPQSDPQPNNWLISDQITVGNANRINITVEYYIKRCSDLSNVGGRYCANLFDLYVNQSDQFIADLSRYPDPRNNIVAYEKVAEIRQVTNIRNFETINVPVKGKHIILAFHNYGACNSLYSVKSTYSVCPGETLSNSLVSLPRTATPAIDSESIRVEGNCSKNAVQVTGSLYVYCDSSGEWDTNGLEGRCICEEDMQNVNGKCEACPNGTYNDQHGLNCTILPSAPKNVTITFVNQSAVEIAWLPPMITGDQTLLYYDVDCRKPCNSDNKCVEKFCERDINYIPYKEGLNVTKVIVVNLSSFVNYTFKIFAKNRVSEVAKRRHGVVGNFIAVTASTNGSTLNITVRTTEASNTTTVQTTEASNTTTVSTIEGSNTTTVPTIEDSDTTLVSSSEDSKTAMYLNIIYGLTGFVGLLIF